MDVLLKEALEQLTRAFSQIEATIPSPRWTRAPGYLTYRYADKSLKSAIVQKLARIISGLSASTILLEHGFVQELGVLQRTLDEIGEDIFFLCLPLMSGESMSPRHREYLDAFYEEEFNQAVDPLRSPQRRRMVPRRKIRSYNAAAKSKIYPLNTSDLIELDRTVHKAYSGYVHAGYVHAASPQIMDMYGGSPPHFHLHGMLGTSRIDESQRDLCCHYFYRGGAQVVLVARCFGLGALAEELRKFVAQFETESECVESRPPERRRQSSVPENDAAAVSRYHKAAAQGSAEAQFSLGVVYAEGRDVPQDYQEAVKWFREAAKQGNAEAQFSLGQMCFYGDGVAQDYQEVEGWLRRAADQGFVPAQICLGDMYFYGRGAPQGLQEAAKWIRKAAEQGNADAQFSLGACYSTGDGVPENDTEAAKWIRKAAEQGNADAQFSLGEMYFYGDGVAQDYIQAHKWFNLATARKASEYSPEVIQRAKNESEKVMTSSQVSEAQRLARDWRPKTKE